MRIACCLTLAYILLHAQTDPKKQFEVASVKPSFPRKSRGKVVDGGPGTSNPGQIAYNDLNLKSLVFLAYDIKPYQLDSPSWMEGEYFDIVAKVPAGATKDDMPLMLRNLLAERFQLKVRYESRESEVYALAVGRTGSKMKEYAKLLPEGFAEAVLPKLQGIDKDGFPIIPPGYAIGIMGSSNGQTRITISRQPMKSLCDFLGRTLQQPVVDQTGLTGRYDIHLVFATEGGAAGPAGPPPTGAGDSSAAAAQAQDPAPTLMSAVQSQLGLRLDRKRLPVEFLVVEHAEKKPTEN